MTPFISESLKTPFASSSFQTPFIMVIFGATGDLAQNKLVPSLFSLFKQKLLPSDLFIVGFSRRDLTDEQFRNKFFKNLSKDKDWKKFSEHLTYQQGDFSEKDAYKSLDKKLLAIDEKMKACITRFFYLATPPQNYETILDFLYKTKLSEGCSKHEESKWTRIIIEKPFGKDLETAITLDKKLAQVFDEKQIFRVDHYLGKETVQNILAFRFANGIFEPIWNKNFIDHIQISWGETKGIEGRGQFFDGVGILRDFFQSHVMQLLASVAMEQPRSFTKEDLRDARAKVIGSIRYSGESVRGQYKGYRNEKDVSPNSDTETFAAMKLFVDTPRFENVPFYLRVGKKMPRDVVEISIVFIQTCHLLFKEYGCPEIGNVLTIRIQPDEGIYMRVIAKKPGPTKFSLHTVNMHFSYEEEFGGVSSEAYDKVLLDIFTGDQMLFNRSDELASSWKLITGILKMWEKEKGEIPIYNDSSWGPKEANELIEKDGKRWIV